MVPLSPDTVSRLATLFAGNERVVARAMLENECAENLPFCVNSDMYSLERIRFAVLKLSDGSLLRLRREIEEAKKDWRDTLMAAGFGYDVHAHRFWYPQPKD